MELRLEYWEKVKNIEPKNERIFRLNWSIARFKQNSCFQRGTTSYVVKPFYQGKKVTVIGAISLKQLVALMTMDNSMDSQAFEMFLKKCLVPQLLSGAVVVMNNLPRA
jgi:hypothetical protein